MLPYVSVLRVNRVFPESGEANLLGRQGSTPMGVANSLTIETTDDSKVINGVSYPSDEQFLGRMKHCQLGLKKSDNAVGGQARCVDGRLPQGVKLGSRT